MSDVLRSDVNLVVAAVFGSDAEVLDTTDIGQDRGVFSSVLQVHLQGPRLPTTVVAKLPTTGPNGDAARRNGAYKREALAYRQLLDLDTPLQYPHWYGTHELPTGPALVLEDLTGNIVVDQLDGLEEKHLRQVIQALAAFHSHSCEHLALHQLDVRRNTPATLNPEALAAGLDRVPAEAREVFGALLARRNELVQEFVALSEPTLTHGDPRADNLVFRNADLSAVFFDWQQLAVQAGEADLAWLMATSVTPEVRRQTEQGLCQSYSNRRDQDNAETWDRYRTSMLLPGLAVLLLAQRTTSTERGKRMVSTSIHRIGAAVEDLLLK